MRRYYVVILLVLIVAAASLVYLYGKRNAPGLCDVNSVFTFCRFDPKSNTFVNAYGKFNCNDLVFYRLNLSGLDTPDSYQLCLNGIRLVSNQTSLGSFTLSSYDNATGMEFTCSGNLHHKSDQGFIGDFGRIPNVSGNVTLLEVYAYPSNASFGSIQDYLTSRQAPVYSFYGEVVC